MVVDPYRTLGLAPGASTAEIKRAYRRLVKAYHPDAAGEAAIPRFLAIQAAYEALIDERGARRGPGRAPSAPWQADPDRARATREAWRARSRARSGPGRAGRGTGGDGAAPGTAGDSTEPRAGGTEAGRAEGAGPAERAGPADGGRQAGRGDRRRRTARPGSTSYDEARGEPFDPRWSGASWYGTSSGTYWTVNPREYADPRKHGPAYQARARRRPEDSGAELGDVADSAGAYEGVADGGRTPADATRDDTGGEDPARDHVPPTWTFAGPSRRVRREDAPTSTSQARELLRTAQLTPVGRVALALVGWVPLGMAFAFAVGEVSGCGRFAASCDGSFDLVGVGGQVAIVLVLLLLPRLAATATVATIAMIAVAFPATAALTAFGGARDPVGAAPTLAAVLAVAWLVGLVFAARRLRLASDGSPPPVP